MHEREEARQKLAENSQRNEETGCLEWTAGLTADGYGQIRAAGFKTRRAHRVAFALAGNKLSQQLVRHKCDNPICIEITHLEDGTPADNSADRVARGRSADLRGEKNPQSKLTWAQAREIKARLATGAETHATIAKDYGVTRECVSRIAQGARWKE